MKALTASLRSNAWRLALFAVLVFLALHGGIDPATATAAGLVLSFETVAGSTLAVSASAPATYDTTGYGALSWTTVGEITDLGSLGKEFNKVTHSPIATYQVIEKKGSYRLGEIDLMCAWDMNDAGQDILRAANDSVSSVVSVRITKQGGDIRYFTAQVSKFIEQFGTVDSIVQGAVTLLRQRDVVYNPA